ncbi:MAG: HAD hydrolase-like protein, partial [Clostridia bacterium]|nr:HAD hydrolase-like protein [Clostridia bacterium]
MNRYELLLADADGTLLDFRRAEGNALRHACDAMRVAINDERDALYRRINEEVWRAYERKEITQDALRVLRFSRFSDALGLSVNAEEMADAFVEGLSLQADEIDGAGDFLERVSALGIRTVVVTNGIASVQRSRFALSSLSRWVSDLVISGELGFAKPDPRMIEKGLEIAGCPTGKALMLGDEP